MDFPTDYLLYIFSPVSSILFTMTAFHLAPVREMLQEREAQLWSRIFVATVSGISAAASLLILLNQTLMGKFLDALASSLALIALGLGLSYSLRRLGHQFLVWLTWMTFLVCVLRQFYGAAFGFSVDSSFIFLHLANSTIMIMIILLIPFAMAWGVPETKGLEAVQSIAYANVGATSKDIKNSTLRTNGVSRRKLKRRLVKTTIMPHRKSKSCIRREGGMPEDEASKMPIWVKVLAVTTPVIGAIIVAYLQFGNERPQPVPEIRSIPYAGRVRDGKTDTPISRANISIEEDQKAPQVQETDAEGIFRVHLSEGATEIRIVVRALGYESHTRRVSPRRTGIEDIRLQPNASPSPTPMPSLRPSVTPTRPRSAKPARETQKTSSKCSSEDILLRRC